MLKENNSVNNNIDTNDIVTIQGENYKLKSAQVLKSLHYKENYVDFHSDAIGNIRTMSYRKQEKFFFEVRMMYDENRSLSELKTSLEVQTGAKEQSKKVDNLDYFYYEYQTNDGLSAHHYMYAYDGKVYTICFFLGEDYGNIEEVFMKNVSFG